MLNAAHIESAEAMNSTTPKGRVDLLVCSRLLKHIRVQTAKYCDYIVCCFVLTFACQLHYPPLVFVLVSDAHAISQPTICDLN